MGDHETASATLTDVKALERLATGGDRAVRRAVAGWLAAVIACDYLMLLSQLGALARQRAGESYVGEALLFVLAGATYLRANSRFYDEIGRGVAERAGGRCRALIDRLLRLPLVHFEGLGRTAIVARMTSDMQRLMQAAQPIANLAKTLPQLAINVALVAILSSGAAAVAIVAMAAIGAFLLDQRRELAAVNAEVARGEERMYGLFDGLVKGASQVKLHAGRASALRSRIDALAEGLRSLRTRVYTRVFEQEHAATAILYGALGVNVFVLPLLSNHEAEAIRRIDFVVVWLFFRVTLLASVLPALAQVADAARRIDAFDRRLDAAGLEAPAGPPAPVSSEFTAIEAAGLVFRYPQRDGRAPYRVGPIDVTLRRGEVVFITGQNGSGKSTLLKMLTGLYPCEAGELRLDGRPIGAAELERWRGLFSTIFTDHHLFDRTYGVSPGALAEAGPRLLAEMQLSHKTGFDGDRIRNLELSTGQKKRLALVLARLRDRPVLVFDEWAAGQDPEFRARFYRELLPALRAAGKLVLAVSHDDAYFHLADRVLHVDGGRLVERTAGEGPR